MQRQQQIKLLPLPISDSRIQIAWNGVWRKLCLERTLPDQHKQECRLVLALVYDPTLRRLVPADHSSR